MTIEEACERINMAEDLLGDALCYLDGNKWKLDRQAIIDQLKAYFEARNAGKPALTLSNGERQ